MPKEDCVQCKKILEGSKLKIFEDDNCVAFLKEKPATIGHISLVSKEHYPIIEQVPDFVVSHMFKIANKLSTASFEALNMQGTNLIVNNGTAAGQQIAHFEINIIPRREGDGLDFQWQPKQLGEEEMATVELILKEGCKNIGGFQKAPTAPVQLEVEAEKMKEAEDGEEENYLIRQLRKIP